MRAALRISLLALVLSVGTTAHAQDAGSEPSPAQVRVAAEAFDKGREAYKAEKYVEAAEQFEKADSNAPSPAALELAIRARDKAGELDRAATLMSLALKRHPDDENLLKIANDLSKRASATLFELTATCDSPCDLTVGGKIVHGGADTQRLLYIQPGKLTVRAGWPDNRSDSKQVEAVAGGKGEVDFVAPTTPAAESMAKEPDEPAAPEPSSRPLPLSARSVRCASRLSTSSRSRFEPTKGASSPVRESPPSDVSVHLRFVRSSGSEASFKPTRHCFSLRFCGPVPRQEMRQIRGP
jgi:hypothetical protein